MSPLKFSRFKSTYVSVKVGNIYQLASPVPFFFVLFLLVNLALLAVFARSPDSIGIKPDPDRTLFQKKIRRFCHPCKVSGLFIRSSDISDYKRLISYNEVVYAV